MRIEWSAHAVADLEAISAYIEQDRSLETANRVARTIYDAVQSLRTLPHRGRAGRIENTRELVMPQLPYRCGLLAIFTPVKTRRGVA